MTNIIFHSTPEPHLTFKSLNFRCAIGKSGLSDYKVEGDHKTPTGVYKLLHLFYRPDKGEKPQTTLPITEITPDMGWCDDPKHPNYNSLISLPFDASHEKLWREDDLYDLVVEISHNNNPPVPGKGSAVFIHIARENYEGTEGCIALKREDLVKIIEGHPENIVIAKSTTDK